MFLNSFDDVIDVFIFVCHNLPTLGFQVTSYASFEFRGNQSPGISPLMKPVLSPILNPISSVAEWQKVLQLFLLLWFVFSPPHCFPPQPFTAPVLPVSASPLMQPASSPIIAALSQHGYSAPALPPLSLSSSTLHTSSRGGSFHPSLPLGLPPLPPSSKPQGISHKPSSSNMVFKKSPSAHGTASELSVASNDCDMDCGEEL